MTTYYSFNCKNSISPPLTIRNRRNSIQIHSKSIKHLEQLLSSLNWSDTSPYMYKNIVCSLNWKDASSDIQKSLIWRIVVVVDKWKRRVTWETTMPSLSKASPLIAWADWILLLHFVERLIFLYQITDSYSDRWFCKPIFCSPFFVNVNK